MKPALWRAVLAPRTSVRALLIQRRSPTPLSYDVAWRRARMDRHPDEMPYRLHGHQMEPTVDATDHRPAKPPATEVT